MTYCGSWGMNCSNCKIECRDSRGRREDKNNKEEIKKCEITKSKEEVEYGIRQMLDRFYLLRERIKKTNAYSKQETEERLQIMNELDNLRLHLKMMGIQDYEVKSDWVIFNIN